MALTPYTPPLFSKALYAFGEMVLRGRADTTGKVQAMINGPTARLVIQTSPGVTTPEMPTL